MTNQELDSLAHWQWKLILSFRWLMACYALIPLVGLGFLIMVFVIFQAIKRSYQLAGFLIHSRFLCAAIAATMLIPLLNVVVMLMLLSRSNKVLKAEGRSETFFLGLKPQSEA